jgi:hypothetical protein
MTDRLLPLLLLLCLVCCLSKGVPAKSTLQTCC